MSTIMCALAPSLFNLRPLLLSHRLMLSHRSSMHHRRAGYPFGSLVDYALDRGGSLPSFAASTASRLHPILLLHMQVTRSSLCRRSPSTLATSSKTLAPALWFRCPAGVARLTRALLCSVISMCFPSACRRPPLRSLLASEVMARTASAGAISPIGGALVKLCLQMFGSHCLSLARGGIETTLIATGETCHCRMSSISDIYVCIIVLLRINRLYLAATHRRERSLDVCAVCRWLRNSAVGERVGVHKP